MAVLATGSATPSNVEFEAYYRDLTSQIMGEFGTAAYGFLHAVRWEKSNPQEAAKSGLGDKIRRNYIPALKARNARRGNTPADIQAPQNDLTAHEDSYVLDTFREVTTNVDAESFRRMSAGGGLPDEYLTGIIKRSAITLLDEFEVKLANEAVRKAGAATEKTGSAFFEKDSNGIVDYENVLKLQEQRDTDYDSGGLQMSNEQRCYVVMSSGDATKYRAGLTGYGWGGDARGLRNASSKMLPDMGGGSVLVSAKLKNVGPASAVTGLRVDQANGIKVGDQTFGYDVSARLTGAIPAGTILNIADGSSFVLKDAIVRGSDNTQTGTIQINRPFNIQGANNKAITTETAGGRLVGICGDYAEIATRLPLKGLPYSMWNAQGSEYNLSLGTWSVFDFSQIEGGIPLRLLVGLLPGSNGAGQVVVQTVYGVYVEAGNVGVIY